MAIEDFDEQLYVVVLIFPISLDRYLTVFQAEVATILNCSNEKIRQRPLNRSIAIFSDSQATLKAVSFTRVTSKLVWDCLKAFTVIGSQNRLTLAWVPGHEGHKQRRGRRTSPQRHSQSGQKGPNPFVDWPNMYKNIHENMGGKRGSRILEELLTADQIVH
ncbi:hypothetical protein NQ317_015813 [Molorchus minor]|uniref:RNase H type-1 domain-containing protein n=1 Tax=Molorchus minor TaxID=1323400 RepID=A0ABQ9JUG9_9CUCU|nr:hypothetical protein NQ317_015813 [Molorchus minor]